MPVYFMYVHLYTACAYTCILLIQTEYTLSCNKSKIVQISSKRKGGGGDGEYHIENNHGGGDGEYHIENNHGGRDGEYHITHTNLQSAAECAYNKQHTHTKSIPKCSRRQCITLGGVGRGEDNTGCTDDKTVSK